jgi:hypothetical protein
VLSTLVLAIATTVAVGSACSSDSSGGDPATALADRVQALLDGDEAATIVVDRLDQLGLEVGPDQLSDGAVTCPAVTDPDVGDGATCLLSVGGEELELVLEFGADDAISIVAVAVAP